MHLLLIFRICFYNDLAKALAILVKAYLLKGKFNQQIYFFNAEII